ncbi:MarR family winged helix-turn-helix transcriptional regulator [Anaerotignum sp.]|nr:MarR family transcriptional regulator [Anaerotignum sp.]MBQ7757945.1 MarR family transcriptional regulator [Anaerotignum sp.]
MEAATGKAIVADMMRLGTNIARWNKEYSSKEKVAKRVEELGLTHHQVEILAFLRGNPELDTVSALSSELHISKGSLSLMLSKLQMAGFVQKKAAKGDDDGRKVYVSLTPKGDAAVMEIMELLIESAAGVFDRMDDERRALIHTKVKELMELFNTGGWKE